MNLAMDYNTSCSVRGRKLPCVKPHDHYLKDMRQFSKDKSKVRLTKHGIVSHSAKQHINELSLLHGMTRRSDYVSNGQSYCEKERGSVIMLPNGSHCLYEEADSVLEEDEFFEDIQNIVDHVMYKSHTDLEYTGVGSHDVSHDSSSGVESGESHNTAKYNSGLTNGNTVQNIRATSQVKEQPPSHFIHNRDLSWSSQTCSDSDVIQGGSLFSSSDTDNNTTTKSTILHTTNNLAKQQQRRLKCKKHVTFQPSFPEEGSEQVKSNNKTNHRDIKRSDILYYEDDGIEYISSGSESPFFNSQTQGDRMKSKTVSQTKGRNSGNNKTLQHCTEERKKSPVTAAVSTHPLFSHKSKSTNSKQETHIKAQHYISDNNRPQTPQLTEHNQQVLPMARADSKSKPSISQDSKLTKNNKDTSIEKISNCNKSQQQSSSVITRAEINTSHLSAHIHSLPDDIIVRVLRHLSSEDVCRSAAVCRRWYSLSYDEKLWTSITISNPNINVDRAIKHLTRRLSVNTPGVCITVEKIRLIGCHQLTDKGVFTIAKRCAELRQLDITGCPLVSNIAMFELVSRCVNLEHLNVTGCDMVTCISLTPQATVQAQTYGKQVDLRYLDMSDCFNLEDSGLQIIASYCTQLVYLYLRRCSKITDIGVQYVSNYCPYVKEFSVSDCKKITDSGMKELSKLGCNLRYLSVAKCELISDTGVSHLARHCPRLRYLNVRGCEKVSDLGVQALARYCLRLRSLDIGKCDVTDDALHALANHSPHLRKLSLKSCDAVTDAGLMYTAEKCPQMQQLNIQECNITVNAYRKVKSLCTNCMIEHTNPGFY